MFRISFHDFKSGKTIQAWIARESSAFIGRAQGGLKLDDASCSRRHAVLIEKDGQVYIYDLNSTNGTYLNGKSVRSSMVAAGDVLRIGRRVLRAERVEWLKDEQHSSQRRRLEPSRSPLSFTQKVAPKPPPLPPVSAHSSMCHNPVLRSRGRSEPDSVPR